MDENLEYDLSPATFNAFLVGMEEIDGTRRVPPHNLEVWIQLDNFLENYGLVVDLME